MRVLALTLAIAAALPAAAQNRDTQIAQRQFVGTAEPFASDAIYFLMTDRFVNGDPSNDHREQGGKLLHTFDRPTPGAPKGHSDNIGYMGGDFKGVLDNADYIRDMGFGAVWITPIVDQPDEAFTGGSPVKWGGQWTDQGKTGYHGYWGDNFWVLDEHLPSKDLDFRGLTSGLKQHGLKTVLDIVCNHGSPAYTMPKDQPKYGKIYGPHGELLADHQNLPPSKLDPKNNPLHRWYNTSGGLAQLSDLNENESAVLDYFVGAYSQWIDQGADAFRIDTIGWMPNSFWHAFSTRIRAKHPGFFMFGEAFDPDAATIAAHTLPRNADVSVLDFPLKDRLVEAFGRQHAGFERVAERLYLTDGPYANPYELMTFYDNHDMARLDASDAGFIDADNFLFTARGIPVIYYGSEIGFERGAVEHTGNRNYFGQSRIDEAKRNPIHDALRRIAKVRTATPALQRGLQVNLEFKGDVASFYRVIETSDVHQTALVLLNKGDAPAMFAVDRMLQRGDWQARIGGRTFAVGDDGHVSVPVPAHGVEVLLLNAPLTQPELLRAVQDAAVRARRH
ncbi:alpha-amylase family glycosyl hydrolase [Lysobacter sp. HA18]